MRRKIGFLCGAAIIAVTTFVLSPKKAFAYSGSGSGTSSDPYIVTTCTQLQSMSGDTSAYYKLTNNIDCSDTQNWNSGAGWVSVGTFADKFSGTLDGDGHSITDVYINHTASSDIGLFGYTQNATIKNFSISGSVTNTSTDLGTCVGAIVKFSFNDLTISHVTSTVDVAANIQSEGGGLVGCINANSSTVAISDSSVNATISGGSAGGLVASAALNGTTAFTISNSSSSGTVSCDSSDCGGIIATANASGGSPTFSVTNSYSSTTLNASGNHAGGLIGAAGATFSTTINTSYSTATINGSASYYGGLVGEGDSLSITNSYASVTLAGNTYVGGLVGGNAGGSITINKSYASGHITSTHSVLGGLVGGTDVATIVDSFGAVSIDSSFPTTVGGIIGAMTNGSVTNSFVDTGINSHGCLSTYGVGGTISAYDCTTEDTSSYFKNTSTNAPLNQWDFTTTWATSSEHPCLSWDLTCSNGDADQDSMTNGDEQNAPNAGDANDDGILDAKQANVASFMNPVNHHYQVVETDCTSVSYLQTGSEASSPADASYNYPMGLTQFRASCQSAGATAHMSIYYFGASTSGGYVLRKWSGDSPYATIADYDVSDVSIGGQAGIKFVYSVTDGGSLDEDGTANGTIVDPVGPGVAVNQTSSTTSALADTGDNTAILYMLSIVLILPIITISVLRAKR